MRPYQGRKRSLRIVFLGTAPFAVPALRALAADPDQLVGVFTVPDRPAGRGRLPRPSAVKLAALQLGLPVHQPDRVSRGEGLDQLRRLQPDIVFVAAFGEILRPEALSAASFGAVNLHASLLPRYRGAAPIQRAIMAGERVTGVTVQWMAPAARALEIDAGDIILQRETEIGDEEDFGSLHDRLADLGASAAVEAVGLIRQSEAPSRPSASLEVAPPEATLRQAQGRPQDHSKATYAPPITPQDLLIDWALPAEQLARLVRALSPRPGTRTTRDHEILKVLSGRARPARPLPASGVELEAGQSARADCPPNKKDLDEGGIPGEVMELGKDGFSIKTGDGCLLVLRVQPAGRKAMSAADYVKGYRLRRGDRLGA